MATRTWHVEIHLVESEGGRTRAEAVLRTDLGTELRHTADAHLGQTGERAPEIGDELAACRALTGLADDLLRATETDLGLTER